MYPEYLVIYERVHGGKAQTPREDLPFLLELPLYWKNVGRTLGVDSTLVKTHAEAENTRSSMVFNGFPL